MVWVVECRRHSHGGAEGADGGVVWGGGIPSPEKFWHFSFEMVHFDAFWSTFRPTIIATTMFMISRGLIMIMKITVCAMRTISTQKPAKICNGININYWSFRLKVDTRNFCVDFWGSTTVAP